MSYKGRFNFAPDNTYYKSNLGLVTSKNGTMMILIKHWQTSIGVDSISLSWVASKVKNDQLACPKDLT